MENSQNKTVEELGNDISRKDILAKFARKEGDTGSPEVQTAILTHRIKELTEHFASHPKDLHSKRGMLRLINERKRVLSYLQRTNYNSYKETISALNLRK